VHLGLFILVRDAMTPTGLWEIGTHPVFWLRLTADVATLAALTVATLGLLLTVMRLERQLVRGASVVNGPLLHSLGLGCGAALLIALPTWLLTLTQAVPVAERGGSRGALSLAALLVFSLVGNAYEELLFRGFLQQFLAERIGATRAVLFSGFAFAFGHVPLATSVTNIGAPLLVFTAYEGLICAMLYRRVGWRGSALAHGGGIFLIASGWM
jgi:membrane protease YdiL (CAAX protease family)